MEELSCVVAFLLLFVVVFAVVAIIAFSRAAKIQKELRELRRRLDALDPKPSGIVSDAPPVRTSPVTEARAATAPVPSAAAVPASPLLPPPPPPRPLGALPT